MARFRAIPAGKLMLYLAEEDAARLDPDPTGNALNVFILDWNAYKVVRVTARR